MRDYIEVAYGYLPYTDYPLTLVRWLINRFRMQLGSLIDVGAGRGEYVTAWREEGFHAHGIDRVDFDFDNPIEPFDNLDQPVDYMFCKSVLEHLYHPERITSWMYENLAPGGRIILIMPDWHSCYRDYFNSYGHRTPFTVSAAKELLDLCGFDNICSTRFRPSGYLMKHQVLGALQIPVANIIHKNDWGKWQFLQNRSRMVLATGIKT